jgi:hypothetical protein
MPQRNAEADRTSRRHNTRDRVGPEVVRLATGAAVPPDESHNYFMAADGTVGIIVDDETFKRLQ